MKFIKNFLIILILALIGLFLINVGSAADNITLEEHDFDGYFKMNVPKGVTFEKDESSPSKTISILLNYRNDSEKINIVYAQSAGAKDDLLKYYEEFAKNDTSISLNTTNNTTVVHFNGDNIIGETNYHDMAIAGDNEKYILMQCDNETLMKSMAQSIKFQ
ncbi:hypothetical protein [uncultured Methanobrevibacter sp.]|uniref:hypothetical protein n=1 Tax=uncultured Methanobrevibacter sp. TaxID=253161 RepID=UPI002633F9DA|nr:hypothetical protein [uncultured Methanobrevibacter sp.]